MHDAGIGMREALGFRNGHAMLNVYKMQTRKRRMEDWRLEDSSDIERRKLAVNPKMLSTLGGNSYVGDNFHHR